MKNSLITKIFILILMLFCLTSCTEKKPNDELDDSNVPTEKEDPTENEDEVEEVHVHDWQMAANIKAPTCAEEGLAFRKCTKCGEKDEFVLNKTAHTFDEGKVTKQPTCSEEGKIIFNCSVCNKNVEQIIPTLDHNVEVLPAKEPGCFTEGLTEGAFCTLCGEVLIEQEVVKELGHAFGESKVIKKATCTEEGMERLTCSTCSATKNITIPALGHEVEYIYATEPTCLNVGNTGKGYCRVCNVLVETPKEVLALGHNYVKGSCIRCHEAEPKDGLKFKLVNGNYYLASIGEGVTGTLNMPLMYNNEYVTGILKGAFDNTGIIHVVVLTELITDIQVGAFDECRYLFDIVVDEDNPNYYVENSCLIDKETKTLLVGSASGIVAEGIVAVEEGAFKNRIGVVSIEIPSTVETIAKDAFVGCENLMTITVHPDNKVYYSQDECLLLKENNTLLLGCSDSIISEGVEIIGTGAFANCTSLTEIKLPSTIKTIMPGAFTNCQLVSSLYISENVTELAGAFEGMLSLTEIKVAENNPKYTVLDGCLVEKKTNKLVLADNRGIIPEGIEIIGTGAFAGNEGIFVLEFPESVKEVEARAFANCINLEKVVFNKALTAISEECFIGCEWLEEIKIPTTITKIGARAFKGCIRLERFEVSDTMKYVEEAAFAGCKRIHFVCEAKKQPDTWHVNWNPDDRPVLWGHYIVD